MEAEKLGGSSDAVLGVTEQPEGIGRGRGRKAKDEDDFINVDDSDSEEKVNLNLIPLSSFEFLIWENDCLARNF